MIRTPISSSFLFSHTLIVTRNSKSGYESSLKQLASDIRVVHRHLEANLYSSITISRLSAIQSRILSGLYTFSILRVHLVYKCDLTSLLMDYYMDYPDIIIGRSTPYERSTIWKLFCASLICRSHLLHMWCDKHVIPAPGPALVVTSFVPLLYGPIPRHYIRPTYPHSFPIGFCKLLIWKNPNNHTKHLYIQPEEKVDRQLRLPCRASVAYQ